MTPTSASSRTHERAHTRNQRTLAATIDKAEKTVPTLEAAREQLEQAIARRVDTSGDRFAMTVGGSRLTSRADAAIALRNALAAIGGPGADTTQWAAWDKPNHVALIGGFDVIATPRRFLEPHLSLVLAGVPRSQVSVAFDELRGDRPLGIVIRVENWLGDLERTRAKLVDEAAALSREPTAPATTTGSPAAVTPCWTLAPAARRLPPNWPRRTSSPTRPSASVPAARSAGQRRASRGTAPPLPRALIRCRRGRPQPLRGGTGPPSRRAHPTSTPRWPKTPRPRASPAAPRSPTWTVPASNASYATPTATPPSTRPLTPPETHSPLLARPRTTPASTSSDRHRLAPKPAADPPRPRVATRWITRRPAGGPTPTASRSSRHRVTPAPTALFASTRWAPR